jgi:hypothetical protein
MNERNPSKVISVRTHRCAAVSRWMQLFAIVSCAIGFMACASSVGPTNGDGGPSASSCPLPDGTLCPRGATCTLSGSCRSCDCSLDGQVTCTRGICSSDGGNPPGDCRTTSDCRDGLVCLHTTPGCDAPGTCVAPRDSCPLVTFCGCDNATHTAACGPDVPYQSNGACNDLPRPCHTPSDCGSDQICVYSEGSCDGRPGTCMPILACDDIVPYCGCDGMTFSDCLPTRPTQYAGSCRGTVVDAGIACPGAPPPAGSPCLGPGAFCGYGICFGQPAGESIACSCGSAGWNCSPVGCE